MKDINVPVIRVEIESARRQIMYMLGETGRQLHAETESALNAELERALAPEQLEQTITLMAREHVRAAIQEAVKSYFGYGNGKRTLRNAVDKYLDEVFSVDFDE